MRYVVFNMYIHLSFAKTAANTKTTQEKKTQRTCK